MISRWIHVVWVLVDVEHQLVDVGERTGLADGETHLQHLAGGEEDVAHRLADGAVADSLAVADDHEASVIGRFDPINNENVAGYCRRYRYNELAELLRH